jgi:hypothetical protein
VALDLKAEADQQQAERKKQEKDTFFAKIWPWKSREMPRNTVRGITKMFRVKGLAFRA